MGNSELKTAFKNALKDQQPKERLGLTAEILLEDQLMTTVEEFIKEKMNVSSFDKDKAFPENNYQLNENAEELHKKQLLSELHENYMTGFATAESNIEALKEPSFEKYFIVNCPETIKEYTKLQQQKFTILYALFVEKYKEQQDKKQNFFEYIQRFLQKSDVNQRVQVGLESGFKFSLSLLKEVRSINKDMLVNSLEYLYQTLRQAEPGSLYSTDKLSFMIDANLNDARSFLVNIIEDGSSSRRAVELAYKIIFLLGVARSNVEDFLLVTTLLDKHNSQVDFKYELELLKEDGGEDQANERFRLKKDFTDRKTTKQGKIFYLKAGPYQREITKKASFACDGQYIYMHQKGLGLLKMGTGVAGQMIGQAYLHKPDYKKEEDVSLLYLNNKIYCRAESLKPKPFVMLNPTTLEEEKDEFELEKEDQNLEWKANEDTGRSLLATPLFSDGNRIYVVAQKKAAKVNQEPREGEDGEQQQASKDDEKKPPQLVIECYDPSSSSFRFVKEIHLYKNEENEPFLKKGSLTTFIQESSFATNGQILMIQTAKSAYFFDMKTGIKQQKVKLNSYDAENTVVTFDYQNNLFYQFKTGTSNTRLEGYTITNFKKGSASFGFAKKFLTSRINSFRKQAFGERIVGADGNNEAYSINQLNVIQRIMRNVTTPALIEYSKEESESSNRNSNIKDMPVLQRTLILRHIEQSCQLFQNQLDELIAQGKTSTETENYLMTIFKYPNATYMTSMVFDAIKGSLDKGETLIQSKKTTANMADQYSFYFILKVLKANFQALSYCAIVLKDLMDESPYQSFLQSYKQCIVKVIEEGYLQDFEGGDEQNEMIMLWQEIYQLCLGILSSSINLIYPDNKEIITNLKGQLKEIQNEKQAENCSISLNYLSIPANIKKLLKTDQDELQLLTEVFKQCVQIKSNDINQAVSKNQLGKVEVQEQEQTTLVETSSRFIRGFSEQLIVQYCALNEQVHGKSVDSNAQVKNEKDDKEKGRLMVLENMIGIVFQEAANEIANALRTLTENTANAIKGLSGISAEDRIYQYMKNSSFMEQLFIHRSTFYQIIVLYVQTFSVSKLKVNILPDISSAVILILREISTYNSTTKQFIEDLKIDEAKDKFRQSLGSFSRNLSWFIGMIAYKLIKVKDQSSDFEKKDKVASANDKMQELIISSNLLSGGIEGKFIVQFSPEVQKTLRDLIKISKDKLTSKLLSSEMKPSNEDDTLNAIINQDQLPKVDLVINILQTLLEKKVPFVPYARLGGQDGMRLSRAAFAVMIKFSEYFDDFISIIDEIDIKKEELQEDDKEMILREHIKTLRHFEQISKRWENASKMRQWVNEKKKNLIEKIRKGVETEFIKKRDEEMQKAEQFKLNQVQEASKLKDQVQVRVDSSERASESPALEQINTSSKANVIGQTIVSQVENDKIQNDLSQEDKQLIDDQADAKFNSELQRIYQKVVDKAELLVKLSVPAAYLVTERSGSQEGELLFINDPSNQDGKTGQTLQVSEFDWKNRLKSWRQMQTSKGAIKSFTDRKKEIFDSSVMSVLACLQTAITAQRIQKQVETVYLNASKRCAGLKLIEQLVGLELSLKHRFDLINWFCSSLRHNKNQLSHYLDDLKGCGTQLEDQARDCFFGILKGLVKNVKQSTDEVEIKTILNSLKWKYQARDHQSLKSLDIFRVLHEGNGDKKNKLKRAWGRPLKQELKVNGDKRLTRDVLSIFEQIFLLSVGRIIKSDTGALIKLKQRGTSVPTLEKAQSVINENVSETLISSAIRIIFKEFERYIRIMKLFKGIDWTIYVKMRHQVKKDDAKDNQQEEYDVDLWGEDEEQIFQLIEEVKQQQNDENSKAKESAQLIASEEESARDVDQEGHNEVDQSQALEGGDVAQVAQEENKSEVQLQEEQKKREEEMQEKEKQMALKKQEERAQKEISSIQRLYSESFLKRLLRLVEVFTSIATISPYPLSMVQRIANPYQLETLLNLLILSSPRIKIVVLKVIQNLIKISIPFEVFEETITQITKDSQSQAYEIINKVVSNVKLEESRFLKFLYNYLLSIRHKMWTKSGIESEGQYSLSCELLRTLRFIYECQVSDQHPWRKTIDSLLRDFLLDFRSLNKPKEAETIFGLIRGCDFNGLATYMSAVTAQKEKLQIVGFVQRGWLSRSADEINSDAKKVFENYSQKDLQVLAMLYNEKHKQKCEYQLYDPMDIKITNDNLASHSHKGMVKKQFQITSEILNHLLEDSDLLSTIDEDDIGSKQMDIFQLNTRTMIMKMINHQLQSNSQQFLTVLKQSNFYQHLLKFVCRESSIEMKGEIMLLEWLEQRCFAIRRYACENQQSLVKQREVHMIVVKDKMYVSFQHPTLKNEKQLNGTKLISAINYKNIEEKKEIKLVLSSDVFVPSDDSSGQPSQAHKQIVLIDPDSLARDGGLDTVNICEGAITYGTDLNALINTMLLKQREDRNKYVELASKAVYLISEQDFRKVCSLLQSSSFKRSATMKAQQASTEQINEENFDHILAHELVNYGGFSPFVANKTLEKEGIENKTAELVNVCKQIKDGSLEVEEQQLLEEQISPQKQIEVAFGQSPEDAAANITKKVSKKTRAEEKSEMLSYLRVSFYQSLDKAHPDYQERSNKDALFDAINNFSKKDLASDYERSMIRLFNMYCRQVFWSLIQKDDIEAIFNMVLENESDMRSFSTFLKVLGNECFVTGNKVYIKGYKEFLKKVVTACCRLERFKPMLRIIILEGVVGAYGAQMEDLKQEGQEASSRRIEDYFKTESKAAQLVNPFIIIPLLKQVVKEDFSVVENYVDDLVSSLIAINNLFVGNYVLKDQTWCLIVAILDKVRQQLPQLSKHTVNSLLKLKIVKFIFNNFDDQNHHEREEALSARRNIKDSGTAAEIEGIPRRQTERLVYQKRVATLMHYLRYHPKNETSQLMIEMLYKFYQIDKDFQESKFFYKNNLMSHMDLYRVILQQGKEGKLNEYLLFYNKLEDNNKIISSTVDTSLKQYEGMFTAKVKYSQAEKILVSFLEKTKLKTGAAILFSSDRQGEIPIQIVLDNNIKKEQALFNVYANEFYMHYPVYPSVIYTLNLAEEKPELTPIEQPMYAPLERYEDHSYAKFFVTKEGKIYIWKNEQLRRYRDQLDIQQLTFGKQCRVALLKNGKVWAEGRNKCRHFLDQESEQIEKRGVEIPFYEKKDKIVQISTFFQVTVAITEKGKVFACGDKIQKMLKMEKAKFGFYELTMSDEPAPKGQKKAAEEKKEEAKNDEQIALLNIENAPQIDLEEPLLSNQEAAAGAQVEVSAAAAELAQAIGDVVASEAAEAAAVLEQQQQHQQQQLYMQLNEEEKEAMMDELHQQQLEQQFLAQALAQSLADSQEAAPVSNQAIVGEQINGALVEEAKVEQPVLEGSSQVLSVEEGNQIAEQPIQQVPQVAEEEKVGEQLNPEQIQVQIEFNDVSEADGSQQQQQQQQEEQKAQVQILDQQQQNQVVIPPIAQQQEDSKEESKELKNEQSKADQKVDEDVEQIDTGNQSGPAELKATKIWACKTVSAPDLVYLVLVENITAGRFELRTLGKSNFGLLGQGKRVTESKTFRRIDFKMQPLTPNHIYIGHDHVILIANDNKVYGWGSYLRDSEEKAAHRPTHMPFFDNYKIHVMQTSGKTVALVSPKDNIDKKMIIVGRFMPLSTETQVKTFNIYNDLNIYNIQPYGDMLYVSTEGNYQYKRPIPEPYLHTQQCEVCSKQVVGVLHLFQDKESKFHFFCQQCAKDGQMAEKYNNPALMWAIKRPMKDLESKPWPKIDAAQILKAEGVNTEVVAQYLTKYKLNGKEVSLDFSFDQLVEPSQNDILPMIFLRVSRPLKEGAMIDVINISQFYDYNDTSGIGITFTPDYGFKESTELIFKNSEAYNDFQKALNEINVFDEQVKKEFFTKIEEYVANKLKDAQIQDIKWQDLKIEEDLKFKNDKLNELTEDCKRIYTARYIQYCQLIWGSLTYVCKHVKNVSDFSLLFQFNKYKHNIPLIIKNKLLRKFLDQLSVDDGTPISIHVNRKKAREFFETNKVDEKGELTIFGQVMRGLKPHRYQGMRINSSDKKAWFVKFIGEFALDQGGLFRESLTELCQELQSHVLNLFVPSQNQKNNHGKDRDKWVLNPAASSPSHLKMYEFLGALIGMSVRSGILMSLNLPSFFWKQLTDEDIILEDLDCIDSMTVQILHQLKEASTKMSEEEFLEGYDLYMTTILSNGEESELLPGGKQIRVNFGNLQQYIDKTIAVRFKESRTQIKALKKGIDQVFQSKFLKMLTWKDLEYKVVGKETIDIERLKELTVYRNTSESHDTIKKYWKIMNALSNEEKMLYLKFVWGRTRLPLKEEEISENHTLQMDETGDVNKLPIGRTCFFRLEIPPYKNEDQFKDKLLYAIKYCTDIDADIEGAVQTEDDTAHQEFGQAVIQQQNDGDEDNEEEEVPVEGEEEDDDDGDDADAANAGGLFYD